MTKVSMMPAKMAIVKSSKVQGVPKKGGLAFKCS